jgi:serine/threonine protein kinase
MCVCVCVCVCVCGSMEGGELLYQIEGQQSASSYTENDARRIFSQILTAVQFLHQNSIARS